MSHRHSQSAQFSIFIAGLGKDVNSKITKFAYDTKLFKVVNSKLLIKNLGKLPWY